MSRTTAQTLVATASDGSRVTYRTRAGYAYAAIAQSGEGWHLVTKGFSADSVRSRARTAVGSYAFEVVPFKAERPVAPAQVPEEIREYFESKRERAGNPPRKVPQIAERFVPGKGWLTCTTYVSATYSEIRRLAEAGATTVGVVAYGSPVAEFPIEPMLRRASLPLFGGSLIGSRTF